MLEELSCEIVFTIPVGSGIPVYESVVVTWIIMAALTVISMLLVRNLKIESPGKRQLVLEIMVSGGFSVFESVLGEKGKKYIPYLMVLLLYIGTSNLIGLFAFKPPTKDLNVTAALALMSILLIEFAGLQKKGLGGWLKSFAEPMPLIAPFNVLEIAIKPLSLCMRLFGNILGGFVVMELIKLVLPVLLPIPFSIYFDLFDGLLQAYIFVFLTSLFINEAME